jgi:hypothetical protein
MSTQNKRSGGGIGGVILLIVFAVAVGPGMFCMGFWQYGQMVRFQREGGRKTMNWLFALLYDSFGPTGVAVPFWIIGGIFIALEVGLVIWLVLGWLKRKRGQD